MLINNKKTKGDQYISLITLLMNKMNAQEENH